MSSPAMSAPALASATAAARPIPRAAPVTTATLPSSIAFDAGFDDWECVIASPLARVARFTAHVGPGDDHFEGAAVCALEGTRVARRLRVQRPPLHTGQVVSQALCPQTAPHRRAGPD